MKYLFVSLSLLFLHTACSQEKAAMYAEAAADSTFTQTQVTDTPKAVGLPHRSLLWKAELKYKVQDVVATTSQIERTTIRMGGFILENSVSNSTDYTTHTPVAKDSSLVTKHMALAGTMTIRIPSILLDSTIRHLCSFADYIDYRHIKAEEVTMQLMANQLELKRAQNHGKRVETAIHKKGNRLADVLQGETSLYEGQRNADQTIVQTFDLQDKVDFSTIELTIYQHPSVFQEIIFTPSTPTTYTPSLWTKVIDALQTGWIMGEWIIIALIKMWFLIALGIGVLVVYRKNKLLHFKKAPVH